MKIVIRKTGTLFLLVFSLVGAAFAAEKARLEAVLNVGAPVVPELVTRECSVVTADMGIDTLLYFVPISLAEQGICDNIQPVLAPDGHHLTLEEWSAATGRIQIICQRGGTRYHLQFKNLIPHGLYTIWHFMPTGGGAMASHPPADIRNVFIADEDGNANHVVLGTEGPMTFFGTAPACTLPVEAFAELFVVLYHTDNRDWGPFPGPEVLSVGHMYIFNDQP